MNLIPPVAQIDMCQDTSPQSFRNRISDMQNATKSGSALFQSQIISPNSFGANEVWAHYTNSVEAQSQFFFPDVGIFSRKFRLVDLFRKRNFACYSEFMYEHAKQFLNDTGFRFIQTPTRVRHPYLLIETLWRRDQVINDFAMFSDSALLFLPKSTDAVERNLADAALLNAINECRKHAKRVSLCIYYRDLERFSHLRNVPEVDVVSCGFRFDILFYFRLNLLINSHKFVAFVEPGSHSIYASISNKKVLYIPAKVERVVKDAYQLNRFPGREELEDFVRITEQLLASGVVPQEAVHYKRFLNHDLDRARLRLDRPASKFPKISYPIYKFAKIIVTIDDQKMRAILAG